jgi:hypothetical protein
VILGVVFASGLVFRAAPPATLTVQD